MAVYLLNNELIFPNPAHAGSDGLLAIGGDLKPDRILLAYEHGIFPWYGPEDPIMWWSPDPRCLLPTKAVKVSKSMRNVLNRGTMRCTMDNEFETVVRECQKAKRREKGTWINEDIIKAYCEIHSLGMAHSVEVWEDGSLIGGLYGVSIGKLFFGESMFSKRNNASKVALVKLCAFLSERGFDWVDCQMYTQHLGSLGAIMKPRLEFLRILEESLEDDTLIGKWRFPTQPVTDQHAAV